MPGVCTEVLLWISAAWTDDFIAPMRLVTGNAALWFLAFDGVEAFCRISRYLPLVWIRRGGRE